MKATQAINRKERNQGMNWISQVKRLAIYLRDGLACAYCGASVEEGAKLTLDHIKPHSKGGTNEHTNLVTCCHKCNSSRGNRSVAGFASGVAEYTQEDTKAIIARVRAFPKRVLPLAEAKELIARRGSCKAALEAKN